MEYLKLDEKDVIPIPLEKLEEVINNDEISGIAKNQINENNEIKKDEILFEEVNKEFHKEEESKNSISPKESENIKLEM